MIGAGRPGLSAAHDLALLGYAVTVFEAAEEPGGMIRFGIPEYRLPRTLIRAEIDKILSLGVTLKLRRPSTPSFGLAELRREGFEAVFLSVGVSKGRDLQVEGVELDGVVKAVDYLLNVNRGLPPGPGPAGGGHRRRLRGLRRGAHRPAGGPRSRGGRPSRGSRPWPPRPTPA